MVQEITLEELTKFWDAGYLNTKGKDEYFRLNEEGQ